MATAKRNTVNNNHRTETRINTSSNPTTLTKRRLTHPLKNRTSTEGGTKGTMADSKLVLSYSSLKTLSRTNEEAILSTNPRLVRHQQRETGSFDK